MNLVGIDFSINSPAFCCLKDGKYTWGSVTRSERGRESLVKNTKKPYYTLDLNENFVLTFVEKRELLGDYSQKERSKIGYFLEVVDSLWNSIIEIMGHEPFHVAMEGLSFGSNGNSLIDISMATALLRAKIIAEIGESNFYVFSPTTIKKFAGKGTLKKDDLYHALYNFEESETNLKEFGIILESNKMEWITPSKVVNKPIDDIVDSTWINLYLKEELEKIYGKSGNTTSQDIE